MHYIFMHYWECLGDDLEPNMGPQFGSPIWTHFEPPILDPDLGPRFWTPILDPDLGL
jgi:hypothetical protein